MKKPMPEWGADLGSIDFQNIFYYAKASEKTEKSWERRAGRRQEHL